MKSQRRFLEVTRFDHLAPATTYGAWENAALPIANIKDIKIFDGAEVNPLSPLHEAKTQIKMRDDVIYYISEDIDRILQRIETPYEGE